MVKSSVLDHGRADFADLLSMVDAVPGIRRVRFMKQQNDDHKGISSITLSKCKADTANHTAEAFLVIEYKDKVSEVVCVPMVERAVAARRTTGRDMHLRDPQAPSFSAVPVPLPPPALLDAFAHGSVHP